MTRELIEEVREAINLYLDEMYEFETTHFEFEGHKDDGKTLLSMLDSGDLGNSIGVAIGSVAYESENKKDWFDKDDFIGGINHGISLHDGTY